MIPEPPRPLRSPWLRRPDAPRSHGTTGQKGQRNTLQRLRRDLDRSSNRYVIVYVIVMGRPGDLVRPIRSIVLKQYRETRSRNGQHLLERRKPPVTPARRAAAPEHHGKRLPSPSTPPHLLLQARGGSSASHDARSLLRREKVPAGGPGAHSARTKGLVLRSWPMVVTGPWPVMALVSSGRV